jgi:type II secretory pathway pseudopilin PulG
MLFEAVLIVLSILLALAVNEWQDARRDERLANQALAAFRQELSQNRARLRELIPYHERIQGEMQQMADAGTVHSYEDLRKIPGFAGFRPAFLLQTAWRSALATGALGKIDYRTVNALSTTYTLQERLDEINRAVIPALLTGNALSDAGAATAVRQGAMYLRDVTGLEREVLRGYDEMLAALDRSAAARR